MKHASIALLTLALLGCAGENAPDAQVNAEPANASSAMTSSDAVSAGSLSNEFQRDHEATSLAACVYAAQATGETETHLNLRRALEERHRVMMPEADETSRNADIVEAIENGRARLDNQGTSRNDDLGRWLNEFCF